MTEPLPEQSPVGRHVLLAVELVMHAHAAILDCRTQPVSDWICDLSELEAKRILQSLAFVAGTLAERLPADTRAAVLGGFLKENHRG